MNISYRLLKLNRLIKNHRIKLFGIWILHILKLRHLNVNLDPTLACNIRCKMCYFSDPNNVVENSKKLTIAEIQRIASFVFSQTIKLQIGSAAEPTISKHFVEIVEMAKNKYHIPDVSMSSNGNLLNKSTIAALIDAGLDEIILSMHGVHRKTYEFFMKHASYDKFMETLGLFEQLKKEKKKDKPQIRINYTVNEDNLADLNDFFEVMSKFSISTLQIRPIRELGNSEYHNFSIENKIPEFKKIVETLKIQCKQHKVLLMSPDLDNLASDEANTSSLIMDAVYRYISPDLFWERNYDWTKLTYYQYCRKIGWGKQLMKYSVMPTKKLATTKHHLNYDIG